MADRRSEHGALDQTFEVAFDVQRRREGKRRIKGEFRRERNAGLHVVRDHEATASAGVRTRVRDDRRRVQGRHAVHTSSGGEAVDRALRVDLGRDAEPEEGLQVDIPHVGQGHVGIAGTDDHLDRVDQDGPRGREAAVAGAGDVGLTLGESGTSSGARLLLGHSRLHTPEGSRLCRTEGHGAEDGIVNPVPESERLGKAGNPDRQGSGSTTGHRMSYLLVGGKGVSLRLESIELEKDRPIPAITQRTDGFLD